MASSNDGVVVMVHIMLNIMLTSDILYISSMNYPGGEGIAALHLYEPSSQYVNVHIDEYTAQTGVTRFTQLHNHWTYNKTENLHPKSLEIQQFTHLLVGGFSEHDVLQLYKHSHHIQVHIKGFKRLKLDWSQFPFVFIETETKVFLLKREKVLSVLSNSYVA